MPSIPYFGPGSPYATPGDLEVRIRTPGGYLTTATYPRGVARSATGWSGAIESITGQGVFLVNHRSAEVGDAVPEGSHLRAVAPGDPLPNPDAWPVPWTRVVQ